MAIKKNLYNTILTGAIIVWWANILSRCTNDTVEAEREVIAVTVAEILKTKEILDEMSKSWICETIKYSKKNTDWIVDIYWYKCKKDIYWEDRNKDYVITVSNLNNEYIWSRAEKCRDKKINYWSLWDRSPTLISNQSVVTIKWETKTIDDASCRKLLNLLQT